MVLGLFGLPRSSRKSPLRAHSLGPDPLFTGIIEACVEVLVLESRGQGARLVLDTPSLDDWNPALGASIAVAGACLTLAEWVPTRKGGKAMAFDLSSETLTRTHLGRLRPGQRVNLERALQLGGRLDGHLVSGHVDGTGHVVALRDTQDGGMEITFEVPEGLERFLIDKGSITLDGVSLTVIAPAGRRFHVALIPLTLAITSLGAALPGDPVHVEADLIGKWVDRLRTH